MPLYLYRCEACGAEEEHIQKFSDDPVEECGTCGGTLHKVITPTAFHLKGGGWYKDLYASSKGDSKSDSASSSDTSSKSASDSGSGSGSDGGSSSGSSSGGDKSSKGSAKSGSGKKAASK